MSRLLEQNRLEAFSDGVLAVIITIMVLELKVPSGASWAALATVLPTAIAYALSFTYVGIYWNNHHHLLRAAEGINGRAMWANLHLLFWISFLPFATAWVGANPTQAVPTAVYGFVLLACAAAYTILTVVLLFAHGPDAALTRELRFDKKQLLSLFCYFAGVVVSFFVTWIADALYVLVALLWLVPDPRLERIIQKAPR